MSALDLNQGGSQKAIMTKTKSTSSKVPGKAWLLSDITFQNNAGLVAGHES